MNEAGDEVGDDAVGQRGAVVEGVAVASHVDDDFGVDRPSAFGGERFERVRVLLGDGRPFRRGRLSGVGFASPR